MHNPGFSVYFVSPVLPLLSSLLPVRWIVAIQRLACQSTLHTPLSPTTGPVPDFLGPRGGGAVHLEISLLPHSARYT